MRSYFRYFDSCSSGARFASTLPCVRTTPFGSAVAPDVKRISVDPHGLMLWMGKVQRVDSDRFRKRFKGTCAMPSDSELIQRRARSKHDTGPNLLRDSAGYAGRGDFVDGNSDGSSEHAAVERRDPLAAILSP